MRGRRLFGGGFDLTGPFVCVREDVFVCLCMHAMFIIMHVFVFVCEHVFPHAPQVVLY